MVDLLGLCTHCGQPRAMFTCHLCGRLVCEKCYDPAHGICVMCKKGSM